MKLIITDIYTKQHRRDEKVTVNIEASSSKITAQIAYEIEPGDELPIMGSEIEVILD